MAAACKGFKIATMKMFKDLKEDMNKSITKIYEYTAVERYEKIVS